LRPRRVKRIKEEEGFGLQVGHQNFSRAKTSRNCRQDWGQSLNFGSWESPIGSTRGLEHGIGWLIPLGLEGRAKKGDFTWLDLFKKGVSRRGYCPGFLGTTDRGHIPEFCPHNLFGVSAKPSRSKVWTLWWTLLGNKPLLWG